jgi:hypothetical protein
VTRRPPVAIPDSRLARDVTELIRSVEPDLLYHHSLRVYAFGALQGDRLGLGYDRELLYVGAMFHDIGLVAEAVLAAYPRVDFKESIIQAFRRRDRAQARDRLRDRQRRRPGREAPGLRAPQLLRPHPGLIASAVALVGLRRFAAKPAPASGGTRRTKAGKRPVSFSLLRDVDVATRSRCAVIAAGLIADVNQLSASSC